MFALFSFSAEAKFRVVDGDSLFIDDMEIRLQGIDAPEYHQHCFDANQKEYHCGDEAYKALLSLVSEDVYCKQKLRDNYTPMDFRTLKAIGKDINAEMVRLGWAVAYDHYTDVYVEMQNEAKYNKRGIWQGKFMRPEFYRALERE